MNAIDEVNVDDTQSKKFVPQLMERGKKVAVEVSATSVGQLVLKQSDNLLWITEKTAKWSCPPEPRDEHENKPPTLVRPLPWLIFLPALLAMRCTRSTLSFMLQLVGYDSITPTDLVRYLQTYRRKVRALKYEGQRLIRSRYADHQEDVNGGGMVQKLKKTFANVVQSSGLCHADKDHMLMQRKKNKCSLNKSANWRVDGKTSHVDDAESDSDDDIQRLRELMEKSFNGDTESDDENYVPSGEDYETSDVPTSDEELNDENEIDQLHNGLNETFEKKNYENGDAIAEEQEPLEMNNVVVNGENGEINGEGPEEHAQTSHENPEEQSDHIHDSSANVESKSSPSGEDNSRDSSKENLSVSNSNGDRSNRQPNQKQKLHRSTKKFNGDNNDSALNEHPNKHNQLNNHGHKHNKRSPL